MTDTHNNTFYLAFKNVYPCWPLIECALLYGIIAAYGIVFNLSVIYVTIHAKSLRGTVNYILALYSFFEILHQHGHFLFVYLALSGQNLIEFQLAAKFLYIPVFGVGGTIVLLFFTGIDRLMTIIFAGMEDKRKKRLYLVMITIITVLFGLVTCFITMSQDAQVLGDQQLITGSLGDIFMNSSSGPVQMFIYILTCIIYLIVGIVIRMKSAGLPSADALNRRTFRALFCILFISIGGYLVNVIYLVLILPLISSPITAWYWSEIGGIAVNIGAASNAPILYFTSTEYHQAFQTAFPFVFKRFSSQTQVAPTQQQQQTQPPIRLISTNC